MMDDDNILKSKRFWISEIIWSLMIIIFLIETRRSIEYMFSLIGIVFFAAIGIIFVSMVAYIVAGAYEVNEEEATKAYLKISLVFVFLDLIGLSLHYLYSIILP
jgi:hypothetical protein